MKEKLIELRKQTGMNRREFAEYFGIPYRTVQDWELGNRQMPDYLLRLMAYKVKMENLRKRKPGQEHKQVLSVIERYNTALELLDSYDHQRMERPKGNAATYVLTYEECRDVIAAMRFGNESELFGKEKDDSFKGSIGNIYQSFSGQEIYESLEEKAANLLYFVTKNHSFYDGNKRIAATMFLYFLDKNGVLFEDGKKLIEDHTLVALTIMIAESKPEEKEMMISVVMNCMK